MKTATSISQILQDIADFPLHLSQLKKSKPIDYDRAESVLKYISQKCDFEARWGNSHCVAMRLQYQKDYVPTSSLDLPASNLRGIAKVVYDYCQEHGLKPYIEAWASSDMNSGFDLMVKW